MHFAQSSVMGSALLLCSGLHAASAALAPQLPVAPGPSFFGALVGIALDGSPWEYMLRLRRQGFSSIAQVPLGPAGTFYFLQSAQTVKQVCVDEAATFPLRFSVPLFRAAELQAGGDEDVETELPELFCDIEKVKGHAAEADVEKGDVLEEDLEGQGDFCRRRRHPWVYRLPFYHLVLFRFLHRRFLLALCLLTIASH